MSFISALEKISSEISFDDAKCMVAGKTEKPSGVDPIKFIEAGNVNGRKYRFGEIPLEYFKENESGILYDGTVNEKRAFEYSIRSGAENVPPVIAVLSKKTGKLNIMDGGHRISAARMRNDLKIKAIFSIGVR